MYKKYFKILFVFLILITFLPNIYVKASSNDVVSPNQMYTYEIMIKDIQKLSIKYPDLISYKSIGKTHYGRDIWAVKLGKGQANVFINGSHHAREWMTTTLNMYMLDQYVQAYYSNDTISGYDVKNILNETSIWFVPMVNPDGVTLEQLGVKAFPSEDRQKLIELNKGSINFDKWKANAVGIDPNRQYPADWEHITNVTFNPSYMNYKGEKPLVSEESKAIADFTYTIDPEIALAYHTAGEILYWNFHNKDENYNRDKTMADYISSVTGYREVAPTAHPSGGGYTDWFIQEFGRPGFTPEIGIEGGEKSLPLSMFSRIWSQNKSIGLYIAQEGYKLWESKQKSKPVNESILLLDPKIYLYDKANFESSTSCWLTPQIVDVTEQKGKWFHIKTWLGDKWVYTSNISIGDLVTEKSNVILIKETPMFNTPYNNGYPLSSLSPQEVKVLSKFNDWFQIQTWLGSLWIYPEK